MGVRVAWTFYDPVTSEQYAFQVNPNEHTAPNRQKKMSIADTSAPDGRTILFEGRREVQKTSWSGVIISQEQFQEFDVWFEKPYQILLTDDRGQEYWVYLDSWAPTRQRAQNYPWKHEYTMSAYVLDQGMGELDGGDVVSSDVIEIDGGSA